jgi:sugar phosphate isomerase/epimerase
MCFDNGHGNCTNTADPLELARRFQDRIFFVHLSDNVGLQSEDYWEDCPNMTKCDQHKIPFTEDYNWDALISLLAGSPLESPLTLEVSQRDPEDDTFLARALAAGEELQSRLDKARSATLATA